MKYTFYWSHTDWEETILVENQKAALNVIKRFKKTAEFCDSLFVYMRREGTPKHHDRCYGYYFKGSEKIRLKR